MRLLKVKFDGDIRRLQVELPNEASAADKLNALRSAVGACFGIDSMSVPTLKYKDDDEDMCTLIEASIEDMLQLFPEGPLYLFASSADKSAIASEMVDLPESVCEKLDTASTTDNSATASEVVDLSDSVPPVEESVSDNRDDESLVAPLLAMGFCESDAISALEKAKGNQEIAVAILLKGEQPPRRSVLGGLIQRFSMAGLPSYRPAATRRNDSADRVVAAAEELDPFTLSGSVVDAESNELNPSQSAAVTEDVVKDGDDCGMYWKEATNATVFFSETVKKYQKDVSFGSPEEFFEHREKHGWPADWSQISIYEDQIKNSETLELNVDQSQRTTSTIEEVAVVMDPLQHVQYFTMYTEDHIENSQPLDSILDQYQEIASTIEEPSLSDIHGTSEDSRSDSEGASSDSEEASPDSEGASPGHTLDQAVDQSANATTIDKAQVFVSQFLSAFRTRRFVPESISSASDGSETTSDRVQRFVSDSLFAARGLTRTHLVVEAGVDQDQMA
jgi:hypothetical protein